MSSSGNIAHENKAGRMTSVMSAAHLPRLSFEGSARVIRVAISRHGRIVDEKILDATLSLFVGSSPDNSLVIRDSILGERHALIVRADDKTLLRLLPGVDARIVQRDETISIDSDSWRALSSEPIELFGDARGVLRVGDTKVLFECIAPPVRTRPQLPLGLRRSLRTTVDWTATVMVAFSFLVHFGGLASLYSDFGDTIVRDDATVIGLVEQLKSLPVVPVSLLVDPAPNAAAEVPHDRVKTPLPSALKPRAPSTQESGATTPSATRPKTITREQGLAMLDHLDGGNTALIASLQPGQSSASAGVLLDGNVPSDSLDRFAASQRGARPTSLLKSDGDIGAPLIPGETRRLTDLVPKGPAIPSDNPPPPDVAPPKPIVTGPKPVSTCPLGRVEATLASVRGSARASYAKALLTQPQAEGKVSYTLSIGPDGRVTSASVSSSGSLPPEVSNTIRGALQSLRFDVPAECSAASISGSFAFVNGH